MPTYELGNLDDGPQPSQTEWPVFGTGATPMIDREHWVELIKIAGDGGPGSDYIPDTHNQKTTKMCNASATAGAMETQRAKQLLDRKKRLSAGDLYKRINGGTDGGSYLEDGMMAVMGKGIATTNTVKYLDWQSDTPAEAAAERKFYKVTKAFLCPTFDHCMSAVLQNYDIVSGITWYNSFFTPKADGWLPAPSGGSAGGHAVHGYRATYRGSVSNPVFGIWHQNSWGPSWGLEGKCVFPESVYTTSVGGWWAIVQVAQSDGE